MAIFDRKGQNNKNYGQNKTNKIKYEFNELNIGDLKGQNYPQLGYLKIFESLF